MEQVAADLPMKPVFSKVGIPRGRGKVARFFRSVEQLLLQDTPGYAPKGYRYLDPTLAGYVKEDVSIRYDPADMAETATVEVRPRLKRYIND